MTKIAIDKERNETMLLGLLGEKAYAATEHGRPIVVVRGESQMALVSMTRKRTHYLVRWIRVEDGELFARHDRYPVGDEAALATFIEDVVL